MFNARSPRGVVAFVVLRTQGLKPKPFPLKGDRRHKLVWNKLIRHEMGRHNMLLERTQSSASHRIE